MVASLVDIARGAQVFRAHNCISNCHCPRFALLQPLAFSLFSLLSACSLSLLLLVARCCSWPNRSRPLPPGTQFPHGLYCEFLPTRGVCKRRRHACSQATSGTRTRTAAIQKNSRNAQLGKKKTGLLAERKKAAAYPFKWSNQPLSLLFPPSA